MASAPACSQIEATCVAFMELSSQPVLILTVTGIFGCAALLQETCGALQTSGDGGGFGGCRQSRRLRSLSLPGERRYRVQCRRAPCHSRFKRYGAYPVVLWICQSSAAACIRRFLREPMRGSQVIIGCIRFSQDDIDDALRAWNGNVESKHAVVRYMQQHGREKETAAWLACSRVRRQGGQQSLYHRPRRKSRNR